MKTITQNHQSPVDPSISKLEARFITCTRQHLLRVFLRVTAAAFGLALVPTSLRAQTSPTIITHPADISRSVGDSVTLEVLATGDPVLRYQWQFKDEDLPGATSGFLTRPNLTPDQAGIYRVKISNDAGSVTSNPATLDVDATFTRANSTPVGLNELIHHSSWGDYDGDGWVDLFGNGEYQNYLYRNNGNGTFTRITADNPIVTDTFGQYEPSIGMWADYNNDGHLDLIVAMGGQWEGGPYHQNVLYRGEGNGSFTRITDGAMVQDLSSSIQPAWGDYDNDGFLDLFFPSYRRSGSPLSEGGGADLLYHNDGTGGFVHVTDGPLFEDWRNNFSGLWMDQDGDGDLELLIPGSTSFLYTNNAGDLSNFQALFPGNMLWGRGPAAADFDNDGDLDVILVADPDPGNTSAIFKQRSVFRNTGPLTFVEDTSSGIEIDGGRSHDTSFADYDNDGWLDVVFARWTYWVPSQSCELYHNNGDGTFTRVLRGSIPNATPSAFSAAWADLNNDGFQDLLLAATVNSGTFAATTPTLFLNGGSPNRWLNVRLVGTVSNRCAIGAKVRIKATINGKTFWQMRQIEAQGYHQNDPRASFGLGEATQIEELRIEWPSGQVTTATNIASNQFLVFTEGSFPKWIAGYGLTGPNAAPDVDPDSDGMPNSVEDVLGGNPTVPSTAGLPTCPAIGGNFVFTFNRADASETPDVSLAVQAGPDLVNWPTVFTIGPNTAASSSGVTITENGAAPDTITVTVPQGTAGIKFARLTVTVTP